MIRVFTSPSQKIGEIGEKLAEKFLVSKGFSVVARNYSKAGGEIDIVVTKEGVLHFCEVKTISCDLSQGVSGETYNPMQNITKSKLIKMHKVAEIFLLGSPKFHETPWQLDGLAVYFDQVYRRAKIDHIENIF